MLARALFSGDEHKRVIFMRASEHTGAVYLPIFNAGGSTMRPGLHYVMLACTKNDKKKFKFFFFFGNQSRYLRDPPEHVP